MSSVAALGAATLLGACDTSGETALGVAGSAGTAGGIAANGGNVSAAGGATGGGAGAATGGSAGSGGSGPVAPMICSASYEAEAMTPSTGEAAEGGWNIYTEGNLKGSHAFKGGKTTLTVHARGSVSGGEWPHMIVKVGDQTIGEQDVSTDAFMAYDFEATLTAGSHDIAGVTLPGAPLLVVGSNGHVAWGFTNTTSDWADVVTLKLNAAGTHYQAGGVEKPLKRVVERIEVAFWGHGMIRPRVGTAWSQALHDRRHPTGRVHFAHTDLSGFALFEEAFDHGLRAAREVAEVLR